MDPSLGQKAFIIPLAEEVNSQGFFGKLTEAQNVRLLTMWRGRLSEHRARILSPANMMLYKVCHRKKIRWIILGFFLKPQYKDIPIAAWKQLTTATHENAGIRIDRFIHRRKNWSTISGERARLLFAEELDKVFIITPDFLDELLRNDDFVELSAAWLSFNCGSEEVCTIDGAACKSVIDAADRQAMALKEADDLLGR